MKMLELKRELQKIRNHPRFQFLKKMLVEESEIKGQCDSLFTHEYVMQKGVIYCKNCLRTSEQLQEEFRERIKGRN